MTLGTVALGVAVVAVGAGALYATRHLLPRADLSEETTVYVRLLAAMFGGLAITIGLVTVFFGLIAG